MKSSLAPNEGSTTVMPLQGFGIWTFVTICDNDFRPAEGLFGFKKGKLSSNSLKFFASLGVSLTWRVVQESRHELTNKACCLLHTSSIMPSCCLTIGCVQINFQVNVTYPLSS